DADGISETETDSVASALTSWTGKVEAANRAVSPKADPWLSQGLPVIPNVAPQAVYSNTNEPATPYGAQRWPRMGDSGTLQAPAEFSVPGAAPIKMGGVMQLQLRADE